MKRNIVVAITGASGVTYAIRLLEVLDRRRVRRATCRSAAAAAAVLQQELDLTVDLDKFKLAMLDARHRRRSQAGRQAPAAPHTGRDLQRSSNVLSVASGEPGEIHYHHYRDLATPIASGSFLTDGMVVCPCSGGTLGAIASGTSAT